MQTGRPRCGCDADATQQYLRAGEGQLLTLRALLAGRDRRTDQRSVTPDHSLSALATRRWARTKSRESIYKCSAESRHKNLRVNTTVSHGPVREHTPTIKNVLPCEPVRLQQGP